MDTQGSFSGSDAYDATSVGDTAEIPTIEGSSRRGKSERVSGESGTGAQDVVQQAQETAEQVIGQAQETAGKVVDQVRGTAESQLTTQKDRAAETAGTVAQAIRSAGEQLKGQDQSGFAQYADMAAERVEQFANYLQSRDLREIVVEVEHFARRQPILFLAGAFTLGVLGARFLKSSGQQTQQGSLSGSGDWSQGTSDTGYWREGDSGGYSMRGELTGYTSSTQDTLLYEDGGSGAAGTEG
ncbi:MAG TPA: hypothetical protein VGE45_06805 [Chloroflexia bacterium]|jgi:ElaB/YqjD/DUF883 family membrane-anchored ribosome-binding protein